MLKLDLHARPSEAGTFYLGPTPTVRAHHPWGILRWTRWTVTTRDGRRGAFTSVWLCGHLQLYWGDGKVDGSRTVAYANRQLDDGAPPLYDPVPGLCVYTDKPSERLALRWRTAGPAPVSWDNMGGS
jgi:hypothetical protein